MNEIRADLRDLDKIDVERQGIPIGTAPPRRKLGPVERSALDSAIGLWSFFNRQAELFRDPMIISDKRPRVTITPPPKTPVGMTPASKSEATLGLGLTSSAFAVVGITTSGGVYGSTTGELGVYIGGSTGIWTNVGAGVGPTYTMVFGPPSDFAGVSIGVGADIGAGLVGFGAMLLFSPPPVRFLGYSVSLSLGVTSIPYDVTVQVGFTGAKPVLNFK